MDKNRFENLTTPFRLIIIDDERAITETIDLYFEDEPNLEYRITRDPAEGLEMIRELHPHVVLTDLKMPEISGLDVLRKTKSFSSETEVILMTAHASAETAIAAMKEGAYDYLIKPFNMVELDTLLGRIAHTRLLEQQNRQLKRKLSRYRALNRLAGNSPAIQRIRSEIQMIADNDVSVLITGETGTGKSLAASLIHESSNRRDKEFITIECASIPKELLESELFGYEKGAFTGAAQTKKGRMEIANGGTLFLDEIGDMPLDLQAKILRAIQEKEITRVGGTAVIPVDIRIIAATNRNLQSMIQNGQFREDLYYRLNVVPVRMPSLKERLDDLPELINDLIQKICKRLQCKVKQIHPAVLEKAANYPWPGNIRELENTLERSLIFADGEELRELLIQEGMQELNKYLNGETLQTLIFPPEGVNLSSLEKTLVEMAETQSNGDPDKTAQLLGITVNQLKKIQINRA